MTYQIKGFKRFRGHEGEACGQGSLYKGSTKVAEWSDDSFGGPFSCDFVSSAAKKDFLAFAKTYVPTRLDFDGALYDISGMDDETIVEIGVQQLSFQHEERKDLERYSKQGLCFRLRLPDGRVELYTSKAPYTKSNVELLRAKHGASLVELVNETLGLALIDEATAKLTEENARFKKLCKTSTLFRVRDPATDETKTLQNKTMYSATLVADLRKRHGVNLIEIINERYL